MIGEHHCPTCGQLLPPEPRRDPPLPPLEVDSLKILAADALASFKRAPPANDWERRVFENAKSVVP